jgi:hypothetical protein
MSATRDDGREGAPGATVAARIAQWRSKTWEELRDLMASAEDAVTPLAASLAAPPVRVTAVVETVT